MVGGLGESLKNVERRGALAEAVDGACGVFIPHGRTLGGPKWEDGEAVLRARAVGECGFEFRAVGEAEFAKAPCAEVTGVADCAADEVAVRIHAIAKKTERCAGIFATAHDADSGASADVDSGETGFGCAGTEVRCCAVANGREPRHVLQLGKLRGERAVDRRGFVAERAHFFR